MLKLRLTRTGGKKEPSYRVVVARERSKRDGRPVDNLGYYNPRTTPATIVIDLDKADYWLSRGAHPTETVKRLIEKLKNPSYTSSQMADPLSAEGETDYGSSLVASGPSVAESEESKE